MRGFNKVILIGNLTRDPELRYTPKGTAVAKLGLAVNRSWRDSETNEMREEVTFVDVDAFGRSAETIGQYLRKGRPILVEGRLKLDSWEDKQTQQKKTKLGVVLETFQFLDSGNRGEGEGGGAPSGASAGPGYTNTGGGYGNAPARRAPAQAAPPASSHSDADSIPPEDDDVPF